MTLNASESFDNAVTMPAKQAPGNKVIKLLLPVAGVLVTSAMIIPVIYYYNNRKSRIESDGISDYKHDDSHGKTLRAMMISGV